MRSRGKESETCLQSNYGHKYDGSGQNGALATVKRSEPLRELGEDETGFNPLDE